MDQMDHEMDMLAMFEAHMREPERLDYMWSVACDVCEGSGKAIVLYPATYWEPAWHDYHPFEKCTACDGTGAQIGELVDDDVPSPPLAQRDEVKG